MRANNTIIDELRNLFLHQNNFKMNSNMKNPETEKDLFEPKVYSTAEMSLNEVEQLFEFPGMNIGDVLVMGKDLEVLRVPSGYLYNYMDLSNDTVKRSVFVPGDMEHPLMGVLEDIEEKLDSISETLISMFKHNTKGI